MPSVTHNSPPLVASVARKTSLSPSRVKPAGDAPPANPREPALPREAEVQEPALPERPALPKPPPDKKTNVASDWIEIALVDEEDPTRPVPFVRYRVEAPGGKVFEGRLDAAGKAMVVGIDSGSCAITFPDLDRKSWSG